MSKGKGREFPSGRFRVRKDAGRGKGDVPFETRLEKKKEFSSTGEERSIKSLLPSEFFLPKKNVSNEGLHQHISDTLGFCLSSSSTILYNLI